MPLRVLRTTLWSRGNLYNAREMQRLFLRIWSGAAGAQLYKLYLGHMVDGTQARTVELPNVDTDSFDDLLSFTERSRYDPFNYWHNHSQVFSWPYDTR